MPTRSLVKLRRYLPIGFLALCTGQGALQGQEQIPPAPVVSGELPSRAVETDHEREQIGKSFLPPPPIPQSADGGWAIDDALATQSAPTMDLEDLLAVAARQNPTIRQARLQITGELAKAMQAGLYPNPTMIYKGEQVGIDVPGNTDSPGEWQGAEVQQRIVTAGKLKLSRDKYLQRAKVAEHQAVAQQFRVCNDIRIHFYRALAAARTLQLRQELLKNAEDRVVTTREMYNLGQANRADVHRENAELQRVRLDVSIAQNDVRQRLLELTSLAGLSVSNVALEGDLDSERDLIDFDQAADRLLQQSPELAAARSKLREDRITLARENVEWVPDIIVSGGAGYNFEAVETTANVAVRIEVPLFDRNQGTIRQAEADLSRQQQEVLRIQFQLRNRLAQEYGRYLSSAQRVQQYQDVVIPESRKAYRISLESYKEDRQNWVVVLDRHQEYTLRRLELVAHQERLRTSEVLIDGFLLHGGLNVPDSATPPGHIDANPNPR